MSSRGTLSFLLILLVFGCREPFDFNYPEVLEPVVVIDGYITTSGKSHLVRVSRSTTINGRNQVEPDFITDADVRITDNQGNFTILNHSNNGIYQTAPQYRAMEGQSYQLVVTLTDGNVYTSALKTLPPVSPAVADLSFRGDTQSILTNNSLQPQKGALIEAKIQKDDKRHFYQWLIAEYFVIQSDLAPEELKHCYIRDFDDPSVVLLQDNPASQGLTEFTYAIDFIPRSAKMKVDFGVEGILLTLAEEDYRFWEAVKQQSENSGSLFDAAPHSIKGNITTANGEKVLGYFGVYRESLDRVFFTELDLELGVGTYAACTIPPLAARPHPCEDCRLYGFQGNFGTRAPVWWRN